MLNVGLIGLGAIGRAMIACLESNGAFERMRVGSVLVRRRSAHAPLSGVLSGATLTEDFEQFIAAGPELIVECAGHDAVHDVCPRVLERGVALTLISVGALADAAIEYRLRAAAERSHATLTFPAGAVGGLDLLAAARLAGLTRVRYVSRKSPAAWKGIKAEQMVDLTTLGRSHAFFSGTARQAALQFPQNANVAAAIALAGLGFDDTEVTLNADPAALRNEHIVEIDGAFGHCEVRVMGVPLPDNPKTSWLAALSLARSVLNASARVVI